MKANQLVKNLFIVIICFLPKFSTSQNFIRNPSFEDCQKVQCTITIDSVDFKRMMNHWYLPTSGTPDVLSSLVDSTCETHCYSKNSLSDGWQTPRTGNVYLGMITYTEYVNDYREFFGTKLISPLVVGTKYYFEMYVSKGDRGEISHNNLGMNLSIGRDAQFPWKQIRVPEYYNPLLIVNDTDWVKVSTNFIADSAYDHVAIGNYFERNDVTTISSAAPNPSNIAYYFFDDITIEEACGIISADSLICENDTATLFAGSTGLSKWALASNPSQIISTQPHLKYKMTETTTFLLYNRCDTQSVTIEVVPKKLIDLGGIRQICRGAPIMLDATYPNAQYVWSTGATDSVIFIDTAGTYWVELFVKGCQVFDTVLVEDIYLDLGPDSTICNNRPLTLHAFTLNATYLWQDNSTASTYQVKKTGTYWVKMDVDGCVFTDSVFVDVINCDLKLEVPNVFTPNGDGINDLFYIQNYSNIQNVHTIIFNRWGSQVFESDDVAVNWDGTCNQHPCAAGQYFYMIEFENIEGQPGNQSGSTALMR